MKILILLLLPFFGFAQRYKYTPSADSSHLVITDLRPLDPPDTIPASKVMYVTSTTTKVKDVKFLTIRVVNGGFVYFDDLGSMVDAFMYKSKYGYWLML